MLMELLRMPFCSLDSPKCSRTWGYFFTGSFFSTKSVGEAPRNSHIASNSLPLNCLSRLSFKRLSYSDMYGIPVSLDMAERFTPLFFINPAMLRSNDNVYHLLSL